MRMIINENLKMNMMKNWKFKGINLVWGHLLNWIFLQNDGLNDYNLLIN